jgi:hypothetical protein
LSFRRAFVEKHSKNCFGRKSPRKKVLVLKKNWKKVPNEIDGNWSKRKGDEEEGEAEWAEGREGGVKVGEANKQMARLFISRVIIVHY